MMWVIFMWYFINISIIFYWIKGNAIYYSPPPPQPLSWSFTSLLNTLNLTVEITLCWLIMFSLTYPFCVVNHIFVISHTRDTTSDDKQAADYLRQIYQLAPEANLILVPGQWAAAAASSYREFSLSCIVSIIKTTFTLSRSFTNFSRMFLYLFSY